MEARALEGLRVIELGSLIGGPFCGTLMAEFGAEVIKVEDPGTGDPARRLGNEVDDTTSFFAFVARNKKCITLDLRAAEGQALFRRLVPSADVVIENFRVGTLATWNLDYPALAAINPRLVLAHVSGFGQTGPYRDRLAFDRIATAFAGEDYITGFPDKPPTRPAGALADFIAAMFCTIGVMFALHHRGVNGGRGQEVDVGLYEGMFRLMNQVEDYGLHGIVPERIGNSNPLIAPAEVFRTRDDQWIVVNAGTDNVWRRLIALMGREDLDRDPRFASQRDRARNRDELHPLIAAWIAGIALQELLERLQQRQIPATKINSVADIFDDPHVRARENIIQVMLASGRMMSMTGIVPKLSASPGRVEFVAPALGAHNDEIYRGLLGLTDDECARLKQRGVI